MTPTTHETTPVTLDNHNLTSTNFQISLTPEKLRQLILDGHLCGADIHAQNSETKDFVQQVCLESCFRKVCTQCPYQTTCAQKNQPLYPRQRLS